MPANLFDEDLEEQERLAFRQLYLLCYQALGGLDIPSSGEGLTDSQIENLRLKIQASAYRVATGVVVYIEHCTRKSTVTYDSDRHSSGDPVTENNAYLTIFDRSFEEVVENRMAEANGSPAGIPNVFVDDEIE